MWDNETQGWTLFLAYLSSLGSGFLYFAAIWVVYELGMAFIDKL